MTLSPGVPMEPSEGAIAAVVEKLNYSSIVGGNRAYANSCVAEALRLAYSIESAAHLRSLEGLVEKWRKANNPCFELCADDLVRLLETPDQERTK